MTKNNETVIVNYTEEEKEKEKHLFVFYRSAKFAGFHWTQLGLDQLTIKSAGQV